MGRESPSSCDSYPVNAHEGTSNYDETIMEHSLHFTDSLKELKCLRMQLYSAAEHFELSFGEVQKQRLVVESLKDYLSKAVISTVDHLGCVASKLDTFLDEKVDEFSSTTLRLSCIEQKSRSYQEFIDRSGLMQNSLAVIAPKYQKHYYINHGKSNEKNSSEKASVYLEDDMHRSHYKRAFIGPSTAKGRPPIHRKRNPKPSSIEASPNPNPQAFSFMRNAPTKEVEKRSHSPLRFMIKRSGSYANRSDSPTPYNQQRCPSAPRRMVHANTNQARHDPQDLELQSKKAKHMLKALLNIHKSKKGVVSSYQDKR
ncbi:unnamed protein product [Cuscuta epithymum]|uniref:Protein ABIL2-like n=1 Tax=Cuscuta epithymum TaxID=186058 RepID=A0AAV0EPI0_9ASTE|nr:unnamed protein product [Cuscuta epithymum]